MAVHTTPRVITFGAPTNLSPAVLFYCTTGCDTQRSPVIKWVVGLGFDGAYHRGGILYRGCDTLGAITVIAKDFGCHARRGVIKRVVIAVTVYGRAYHTLCDEPRSCKVFAPPAPPCRWWSIRCGTLAHLSRDCMFPRVTVSKRGYILMVNL